MAGHRHTSEVASAWGTALRAARMRSGLSVRQLSLASGVAHGTVTKILQGRNDVVLRHIIAVAEALGASAEVVIEDPNYGLETGG